MSSIVDKQARLAFKFWFSASCRGKSADRRATQKYRREVKRRNIYTIDPTKELHVVDSSPLFSV